ncbi:MAG: N-acetyl-gamma-glutamyl-phosphate reductase [Phycisphaerales bacterium]|nr:N-acetyl-gamma-glutamyl-phosphate reductase [Phycisphaerales bacterium]
MTLRCVVIGAAGYTGAEVCRLLVQHPGASVVGLFGSARRADDASTMGELFGRFRERLDLPVDPADPGRIAELGPDAAFLATPHEASVELAKDLLDRGIRVFDLSAAYRLPDAGLYPKHYGFEHAHPDLLESAVYGLVEVARERLKGARLVAVPGCYPTSAILPLRPLVDAGAIRAGTTPVVSSISGVSGAGRSPKLGNLFCEVGLEAYGALRHRHQPEIGHHAGVAVRFTPHLAPLDRGIVSTIHVELAEGWDAARVRGVYKEKYGSERFVRLLPEGRWPKTVDVRGTNCCDIGLIDDGAGHLVVSSSIDNLVKGAAGQAVQCMNVSFGLPETHGLEVL